MICQQFRESKTQVGILPLKGHKASHTELFQAVMQENVSEKMVCSWLMVPEIGWETFLKAQIAESGILNWQCFNTAAFCVLMG